MGFVTDTVDTLLGGAPKAPDPYATANAQSGANLEAINRSAAINQFNQVGPGFNINWTGEIGDPNRTLNYSLSPERQQLADMMNANAMGSVGRMGSALDFSGLPSIPGQDDFAGRAGEVSNTMYDALRSRLDRTQGQQYDQTVNELTQRGLPISGEAWGTTMGNLQRGFQDADLQAALAAEQLGMQEDSRLFGQQMAARGQGVNETMMGREADRAALAAMLGMSPENVTMPNQASYQVAPPDISGLISNNYNQQMGQYQNTMGGLSNLGSAGAFLAVASHPSFKVENQEVADILPRIDMLKVEAWKYRPGVADGGAAGFHIGPYADQFKELFGIGDGVTINLSDAVGILFAGVKEVIERINKIESQVMA